MSQTNPTRISRSGLKCLQVLKALKGHTLTGLSNGDLSKALGESPATINRCLNTLIEAGMATQLDTGRYAHSVALLQVAQAYANEMTHASARINELTQRVSAGSH
ncbi:helix-turn-helix domain-containing protein [Marinobacter sp.]|uniref:helix-turn-helix domain-containing protein n=1 Tax=Marinobacter sp. TaxID=50741 RepID=UPI0034A1D364